MSAETLRHAATAIREDYSATETDNGEDDPFMFAVADWLEDLANRITLSRSLRHEDEEAHALAVTNAYLLGEPA